MPQIARPRIVVTRSLPDAVEARMRELFDVRLNTDDRPMTHSGRCQPWVGTFPQASADRGSAQHLKDFP